MFRLPEKITIWNEIDGDGFGGITYSDPVIAESRQALKQEKFTDKNGDQQISKAVCYSRSTALQNGSMVFFGESTDSAPPAAADDVRAISQIPSGAGDLKKVWF